MVLLPCLVLDICRGRMFPSAAATVIVCSVASNSVGLCRLVPELEFKMRPPPPGGAVGKIFILSGSSKGKYAFFFFQP